MYTDTIQKWKAFHLNKYPFRISTYKSFFYTTRIFRIGTSLFTTKNITKTGPTHQKIVASSFWSLISIHSGRFTENWLWARYKFFLYVLTLHTLQCCVVVLYWIFYRLHLFVDVKVIIQREMSIFFWTKAFSLRINLWHLVVLISVISMSCRFFFIVSNCKCNDCGFYVHLGEILIFIWFF